MALASGAELLALVGGFIALYLVVSVGYRRLLFQWLPDPTERSPEADQPVGPGEQRCAFCGAINDRGFAKCYECGRGLPGETGEEQA